MKPIVPELFIFIYKRIIIWLDQQHRLRNMVPPKAEKRKWDLGDEYEVEVKGRLQMEWRNIIYGEFGFDYKPNYFMQKRRDAEAIIEKRSSESYISIDSDLLANVLHKLGYRGNPKRLYDLLDSFYEKHNLDSAIVESQDKLNRLYENSLGARDSGSFQETLPLSIENIKTVKTLIQKFYRNLTPSDQLIEAWNLLSPDFQRRAWGLEFEKFKLGYFNFRGIRNLEIFNITQNDSDIDASVYYDDEIEAYLSSDLLGLESFILADLDEFTNRINKLKEKVLKAGGSNFERIELFKFFDPVASEYIWYKCSIPQENHHLVFSGKKSMIVKRLYYVTCRLIDGTWYINGIRTLKTYSAR